MLEVEGRPGGAGRAAVCRGSGGAGRGLAVKRGDIVAVSLQGDYGKPRPALIVQSTLLAALETLLICPITSAVRDAAFRTTVAPANAHGLPVGRASCRERVCKYVSIPLVAVSVKQKWNILCAIQK